MTAWSATDVSDRDGNGTPSEIGILYQKFKWWWYHVPYVMSGDTKMPKVKTGDTIKWTEEWAGEKTFVAKVNNMRTVEIDEPFGPTKTLRKFKLDMVEGEPEKADPSMEYPNSEKATPEIDHERLKDAKSYSVNP